MKNVIAIVVAGISFLLGFNAGTLTATIIGLTIIKCMLAAAVGSIIIWLGCTIAGFIQLIGGRKRK